MHMTPKGSTGVSRITAQWKTRTAKTHANNMIATPHINQRSTPPQGHRTPDLHTEPY
jgi:hypothetical protein